MHLWHVSFIITRKIRVIIKLHKSINSVNLESHFLTICQNTLWYKKYGLTNKNEIVRMQNSVSAVVFNRATVHHKQIKFNFSFKDTVKTISRAFNYQILKTSTILAAGENAEKTHLVQEISLRENIYVFCRFRQSADRRKPLLF